MNGSDKTVRVNNVKILRFFILFSKYKTIQKQEITCRENHEPENIAKLTTDEKVNQSQCGREEIGCIHNKPVLDCLPALQIEFACGQRGQQSNRTEEISDSVNVAGRRNWFDERADN